MRVKRGQLESHSLGYFFLVVVVLAVLIIGYNAVLSLATNSDRLKVQNFQTKLSADTDALGSKVQSVRQVQYSLPQYATKACFLDTEASTQSIGAVEIRSYPSIWNSYASGSDKNVFIISDTLKDSFHVDNLALPPGVLFTCLPVQSGVVHLSLEATSDGPILLQNFRVTETFDSTTTSVVSNGKVTVTVSPNSAVPVGPMPSELFIETIPSKDTEGHLTETYKFGPPGLRFEPAATLTLAYYPELIGEDCPSELFFFHYDDDGNFIERIDANSIDCAANTADFSLSSFSTGFGGNAQATCDVCSSGQKKCVADGTKPYYQCKKVSGCWDWSTDTTDCGGNKVCDGGENGECCIPNGVYYAGSKSYCCSGIIDPDYHCSATACPEGHACDDGKFCTENPDHCASGVCTGTPMDCSAYSSQCNTGYCDETYDLCNSRADTGTSCPSGKCLAGNCCVGCIITSSNSCVVGTNKRNCGKGGASCVDCGSSGTCTNGACAGSCTDPCSDDSVYCTYDDHCVSGTCVGTPITCPGDECNTGICMELIGGCTKKPKTDGTACTGGQCVKGNCVPSSCQSVTSCTSGDGCCPTSCTNPTDTDCPATCLDGCHIGSNCYRGAQANDPSHCGLPNTVCIVCGGSTPFCQNGACVAQSACKTISQPCSTSSPCCAGLSCQAGVCANSAVSCSPSPSYSISPSGVYEPEAQMTMTWTLPACACNTQNCWVKWYESSDSSAYAQVFKVQCADPGLGCPTPTSNTGPVHAADHCYSKTGVVLNAQKIVITSYDEQQQLAESNYVDYKLNCGCNAIGSPCTAATARACCSTFCSNAGQCSCLDPCELTEEGNYQCSDTGVGPVKNYDLKVCYKGCWVHQTICLESCNAATGTCTDPGTCKGTCYSGSCYSLGATSCTQATGTCSDTSKPYCCSGTCSQQCSSANCHDNIGCGGLNCYCLGSNCVSCSGCVLNGQCYTSSTDLHCGTSGNCVNCILQGKVCQNGICKLQCDSSNCYGNTGCGTGQTGCHCESGVCVPGSSCTQHTMVIDGNTNDWAGIDPLASYTSGNFAKIYVANDAPKMYFWAVFAGFNDVIRWIMFDLDNNAATGCWGGADAYLYIKPSSPSQVIFAKTNTDCTGTTIEDAPFSLSGNNIEISLPISTLNSVMAFSDRFKVFGYEQSGYVYTVCSVCSAENCHDNIGCGAGQTGCHCSPTGSCVPGASCSETDSGNDPFVWSITQAASLKSNDTCVGTSAITEWYCQPLDNIHYDMGAGLFLNYPISIYGHKIMATQSTVSSVTFQLDSQSTQAYNQGQVAEFGSTGIMIHLQSWGGSPVIVNYEAANRFFRNDILSCADGCLNGACISGTLPDYYVNSGALVDIGGVPQFNATICNNGLVAVGASNSISYSFGVNGRQGTGSIGGGISTLVKGCQPVPLALTQEQTAGLQCSNNIEFTIDSTHQITESNENNNVYSATNVAYTPRCAVQCSSYASAATCPVSSCDWCPKCKSAFYTGGNDRCVNKDSCPVGSCTINQCSATCDSTHGFVFPSTCTLSTCSPLCVDTDRGMNYTVKGKTAKGLELRIDNCTSGKLMEHVCIDNQIVAEAYTCPSPTTCYNGTCTIVGTCTDTDPVGDLFVRGTVSGQLKDGTPYTWYDTCVASMVNERFCVSQGIHKVPSSKTYDCDFACENGKCINFSSCSNCTKNWFSLFTCHRQDCQRIPGGCYFINNPLFVQCLSCAKAVCSNFTQDKTTCEDDPCRLGCVWDYSKRLCKTPQACVAEVCSNGKDDDCDGKADSQDEDCWQCATGVCCDTLAHNYRPQNFACSTEQTLHFCNEGEGCGKNVYRQDKRRYCSGTSSGCTGSITWDVPYITDYCTSTERCVSGNSACQPC
ncbi:MAG: hypothetical protein V1837_02360 [Candidatus Woesearchaeota archaeon]